MPDFDKLHEHASSLARLTAPGQQCPGLTGWSLLVAAAWKSVVDMWEPARGGSAQREARKDQMIPGTEDHTAMKLPGRPPVDFTRATEVTPEVAAAIDDAFEYHAWTPEQIAAGKAIREALAAAVKAVVAGAPPSPDRTIAIRKIREARMDANSAITHRGRY